MSHFRVPPPVFVGGRQPYAPRLGIAQSGPTPDQPPVLTRANLAIVLDSWKLPFAYPQGYQEIAPLVPVAAAPSGPPIRSNNLTPAILAAWVTQPTAISLASFAGQLVSDQPPARTYENLTTILNAWRPPFVQTQGGGEIAPLLAVPVVPDQPPVPGKQTQALVVALWQPPHVISQGYADIAPLAPAPVAPDQPPIPGKSTTGLVIASWQPPHVISQGYADIAPIVPAPTVPDAPPIPGRVTSALVVASWQRPFYLAQSAEWIAPLVQAPVVSNPPFTQQAIQIAFGTWRVQYQAAQGYGDIAPFVPPDSVADTPPSTRQVTVSVTTTIVVNASSGITVH